VPELRGEKKDYQLYRKMQAGCNRKNTKALRMWKETVQRPPPQKELTVIKEPSLDYEFFDRVCI
jgi:hypothetical protein